MANWKIKIDISDLLVEDESPETAVRVAKEVAKRLRAKLPETHRLHDDELQDIIESFETAAVDCEEFNYWLNALYNWGDYRHRLFVNVIPGLPLSPDQNG